MEKHLQRPKMVQQFGKERDTHSYVSTCELYPSINEKLLSKRWTLLISTDASRNMSVTSSCMENDHCYSAIIAHGKRNLQTTNLMSPWDLSMELKRVSWLAATFNFVPPHQKIWTKHRLIPR